jgi:hypothetical protein
MPGSFSQCARRPCFQPRSDLALDLLLETCAVKVCLIRMPSANETQNSRRSGFAAQALQRRWPGKLIR